MALQMSTLPSRVRFINLFSPLSRSGAAGGSVGPSVKFTHIVGVLLPKRQAHIAVLKRPASLSSWGISNRLEKFSTASGGGGPSWGIRAAVRRVAVSALGVTTAVAACLSTSAVAMAAGSDHLKLDSAKVDWKEVKETLLSMSLEERRKHYRSSSFVELEKIPVWTPPQTSGAPGKLHGKISLYSGDITKLEIDGIVNAANKTLLGGGGVDGAIHRTAGPLLRNECAELRGCETGEAKITGGYGLPAKHVIHTVGPIVMGGVGEEESSRLRDCYRNCLETATQNQLRTVAFPCISTGVYGYPSEQAVDVALATVRDFLDEHLEQLDRVIFCVFLPKDKDLYEKTLPVYFPSAC